MSRSVGAHTADPCLRCYAEAVREGTPLSTPGSDRIDAVGYARDRCAHTWSRPVPDDLEVHDVVRVNLPEATLYGTAWEVEEDRVQVRGSGGMWLVWVERWRVVIY
ncbi:hypothetical protein YUYDRAFT_06839 [Streptomyces sp. ScaeMP-e48]|uniref:hypothetical protein n=1 Tax=Streptomyces sp. ScaeMP-e48 TaxID=1100823 RepID=UPI000823939C|nr:hypothetical protein [Streptomyces sp. ScaeMP-e48]SCK52390.1 hypothetical protein YUYDRAFT_06839 [Streptomyces sp. ScaeMP-e48]